MGLLGDFFFKKNKRKGSDNLATEVFIPELENKNFDFSQYPNAEYIHGEMPKHYSGLNSLKKLKRLKLSKHREFDFSLFSSLSSLEELCIYDSKCDSFQGLESLKKLKRLDIEKAPKLITTKGLGKYNKDLEWLRIYNCKKLEDAESIGELLNLKQLRISKINCLKSIDFLNNLNKLDFIFLHPDATGVLNDDYYPIVKKLKDMGRLDQLKSWKKLYFYLDNSFVPKDSIIYNSSDLQEITDNLSIRNWVENLDEGLEQYTHENCDKAISIITTLVHNLELNLGISEEKKVEFIKTAVIEFNHLNIELGEAFIETSEREELCDIFDNIADAVGIDTQKYEDGIASEWREW
jgi:hypothetical protein